MVGPLLLRHRVPYGLEVSEAVCHCHYCLARGGRVLMMAYCGGLRGSGKRRMVPLLSYSRDCAVTRQEL